MAWTPSSNSHSEVTAETLPSSIPSLRARPSLSSFSPSLNHFTTTDAARARVSPKGLLFLLPGRSQSFCEAWIRLGSLSHLVHQPSQLLAPVRLHRDHNSNISFSNGRSRCRGVRVHFLGPYVRKSPLNTISISL